MAAMVLCSSDGDGRVLTRPDGRNQVGWSRQSADRGSSRLRTIARAPVSANSARRAGSSHLAARGASARISSMPTDDSDTAQDSTSCHVRRAREGDSQSIAWLVERFAPALLAQAHYRLRSLPRGLYDPEDLVQDAWIAALPHLPSLSARDARYTPVL